MSSLAESLPITWRESADPAVYEEKRSKRVFNAIKPSRYPLAVVEASEASHVLNAVKLANELGVRVSVRSGGHSWAGWSVRDNAILIDLGQLKEMDLDEETGIVKVSPSTTGRVLNGWLESKGRLFPGGHCPDVGVGGFLLQGGMGWNCKNWGWACELVKAIDVVTAAGEAIHCNSEQNADLYWAARGSGPGFPAIITRFYLQTRKRPVFMQSTYIWPISEYKAVMDWVTKVSPESDEGNEIVAVGLYPPGIDQPCILSHVVAMKDTEEECRAALKPLDSTRPPGFLVDVQSQPTTLENEYKDQEAANPAFHRYCAENAYLSNDTDVAAVLEKAFTTLPHKKAFSLWFSMAPCSRRTLPDMALSMQSDHYFALYTVWDDAEDDVRCKKWVKDIMEEVEPHSEGSYLGDSDFQIRQTRFWTPEAGKRLMEIRKKWNPNNVICGFLDAGDKSGADGIANLHKYKDQEAFKA